VHAGEGKEREQSLLSPCREEREKEEGRARPVAFRTGVLIKKKKKRKKRMRRRPSLWGRSRKSGAFLFQLYPLPDLVGKKGKGRREGRRTTTMLSREEGKGRRSRSTWPFCKTEARSDDLLPRGERGGRGGGEQGPSRSRIKWGKKGRGRKNLRSPRLRGEVPLSVDYSPAA